MKFEDLLKYKLTSDKEQLKLAQTVGLFPIISEQWSSNIRYINTKHIVEIIVDDDHRTICMDDGDEIRTKEDFNSILSRLQKSPIC